MPKFFVRHGSATYHAEAKHIRRVAKYVKIESKILQTARGVIAVSQSIKDELIQRDIPPESIAVIHNGINDIYGIGKRVGPSLHSKRIPTLIYIGRLIEIKNVHLLINSVFKLKKSFQNIQLLIAGDGPCRDVLREQVEKLDLVENVRFLGSTRVTI